MTFTTRVLAAALMPFVWHSAALAQSSVEQNSNIVGTTLPGFYRGVPGMQDNEASCAINPILPRNIVCAWNASGGSDDLIGDTWIRFSESIDGGKNFFNRYLNGSNKDPATSVGQQFGADPVMMCWPGGCGTVMIASTRATTGGRGGGIYMQMMVDLNTESGFRKAFNVNLDQVYNATGSKFADKPHATYMLDETNPGTVSVTMTVESPNGGTEVVTREWPKARILIVFALFNPSKNDIEILSTYSDDYGGRWSSPKQVAVTSGRDQGVSLAAIGDTVFYGFRRFANGSDPDSMMGVVSNDRGRRIGKPFQIGDPVCAYDVPTLPNATNNTAAASRTNDFPWTSQNGSNFIMVYSERRRSSDGGCLTLTNEPSDSRIVAIVGSANGRNWSDPVEVAPTSAHGFQFMPSVDCSLGVCQISWWDTRRDSARTREFLLERGTPVDLAALDAFETIPIFADFNFATGNVDEVIQFRRTADMYTKKFALSGGALVDDGSEAVLASRYRLGLFNGELIERESNPFHVKAYKTNTVPFMSDYSSITSVKHRLVFDADAPETPTFWEDNSSPNALNPTDEPLFWLAWTDARNVRGQLYTAAIDGQVPYTRTPAGNVAAANKSVLTDNVPVSLAENSAVAEAVEDSNPGAMTCVPTPVVPAGQMFTSLNNRTKDVDIYGALIEKDVSAWSLNPTKTLGSIQRAFVIVAENEDVVGRTFRFEIANQPAGFPATARASWDQLPFDPTAADFAVTPPDIVDLESVGPKSSASVALFVVSQDAVNPVAVRVFDDGSNELINTITVNGSIESGPLLSPNGTLNDFELHNPSVLAPDQFNPDQYNPDQYNPDQFNPDMYNPDQFNPDQFNPDQYNPDQFNPDQFNPDQFNPDQFNPDQFNPDQFNVALTDSDTLDNPEIPDPNITPEARDADGTVVKLDVNYGVQNMGNTLTPYSVDFAVADPEVLALITNGEIVTQLIAWQDKQVTDIQYCSPALVSENRVIAAVNDPDLTQLNIPDIANNRVGALTYFIAPGDILQNTLRFIGPRDKIQVVAEALPQDIISYVFASQAANTDEFDLGVDREQVINDRTPATFNFTTGSSVTFEATGPSGALLPPDFVQASKGNEIVPVSCAPALGTTIGLDIQNSPMGPTPLDCTATSQNGVTAQLNLLVSVLDTQAPTIDPTTVPANILAEATTATGGIVTFGIPFATDAAGVDPTVAVSCEPDAGSEFLFASPGPTTTTVVCTASDDSLNTDTASFDVTIQDTQAPIVSGLEPPAFEPPLDRFVLDPSAGTFQLFWGPVDVQDPDPNINATCSVGVLDLSRPLYTFVHSFDVGTTVVTCTISDSNGNFVMGTFEVEIFDETPPVLTLIGEATLTIPMGPGPYVDPGATAVDNADGDITANIVIDASDVDTTMAGTYSVFISATDSSGNSEQFTRIVVVEFSYGGASGIIPTKTNAKVGSSNPLLWAWLDTAGNAVDSSGDTQLLSIRDCSTGEIVLQMAGDPGSSGFRFKSNNFWQFNWETAGEKGQSFCATVESSLTGQSQSSPPINLR